MKRRVAIVSSCCPPLAGHPVTGGGLRTLQLVEAVRAAGHAPQLFVEAAALPAAVEGITAFELADLEATLRAARVSVVIVEQWALVRYLGTLDRPLIIDLHGSLLLENVYRRGELDLVHDARTKLEALHRADLLLTPAEAQIHHFSAWATLAGFDPRELPIALFPLALPGEPAAREPAASLKMVYGGARWPWIDSLDALRVAGGIDGATLDVFTYDPPRHGLEVPEDLGTWAEVDSALAGLAGVTLHGGEGSAAYGEFLRGEANVALDLWQPNAERMLAATTRTVEFLHAGLPVVTVAGSAWAAPLVASGAGWAVDAGDDARLAALLEGLVAEPARITAASAAATRLADEHRVGGNAALADFLRRPQRPPRDASSLVESIIAVREAHLAETLASHDAAHAAEHDALVAKHADEVAARGGAHRTEVAALSARHADATAEQAAEHRAQLADVEARWEARRRETEARFEQQLAEQASAGRVERERLVAEADARVASIASELQAAREAQRLAVEGASETHRLALEANEATHKAHLDEVHASYRRDQELSAERARATIEAAEQRRARDKEAAIRTEVELRARIAELEALAPKPSDGPSLADALPGRVQPALRFARLWVQHALDRDAT